MNLNMMNLFSHDEQISHYEVSRLLGKGGFATVYAARRKNDGLLVACKMIDRKKLEQDTSQYHSINPNHRHPLPSSRSTSMLDRLNAEITIHHQVKHPNIVELLNCFFDEKCVYLILEYCSRGDLEHYLKEKKTLSEHETQLIVKQVVDGLVYLHNHGIIHRDIKLSNLLLTETLDVKIADFGLAKKLQLAREQNNETMCGTPNYISPEIASRTPHSFATDVWSLGILIATLLTGRPPFDTDTVHGTLNKVTQENYELPANFSEEAQDLVNSTLKKTAELRPNIIEIRDHPFFRKDFLRTSLSYNEANSYQKFSFLGPNTTVDRSIDSGLGEPMGRQRSTLGTTSTSTSVASGTYSARQYSSDRISSPHSSHHNEPIYKTTANRSRTPHERYLAYPISASTPAHHQHHHQQQQQQQPVYAGQSPSFDPHAKHPEWISHGTGNTIDHRPDSATSSVRSQDSGVAQSDPKTSHDFSAKSESSSKTSGHYPSTVTATTCVPNGYSTTTMRQRLISAHANQQQQQQQQQQVLETSAEHLREKLQPLNTQRLKSFRQATKSYIMSIMDNGEVVLESIRTKGSKRRIVDVFRVSSDGLHIITYAPNSRHGSPAADHPPPIPRDRHAYQEHLFDQLPMEYWKKYQYAHKFVTLVRSRTPKVILYTPDAKCLLMETGVDFEVVFLCGLKMAIYRENYKTDEPLRIKILNHKDKSESLLDYDRLTASNRSAIEHFSPEIRQMLDQTVLFYKYCLAKEKILEECQKQFPSIQTFPVQFGKKHTQNEPNRPATPCLIGRTVASQFGGSSSTVNELAIAPSTTSPSAATATTATTTTTLAHRREFGSETDIRSSRHTSAHGVGGALGVSSSSSHHNHVQHSNSSSTLRNNHDYPYAVHYNPQSSVVPRSHSVHPFNPDQSSLSTRQTSIAPTTNYTSTTSLNSTASGGTSTITGNVPIEVANGSATSKTPGLTRKTIMEYPTGTYRVTFSDNSVMIIHAECTDGQTFIDSQGKRYTFDRRQPHQPEPIQERLALMYQDDHDLVHSSVA